MPICSLDRSAHSDFLSIALCFYAAAPMKRIFASVLTTLLIVAMTLAAMFTLVRATVYVTSIESPLQRAIAIAAELLLGVVLLLGTVWLATHLAVRIFGVKESAPPGGPVA
jgi:hypothetical protein